MSRNAGNIGKRNITSSTYASGKFDSFDQFNAVKLSSWPVGQAIKNLIATDSGNTVTSIKEGSTIVFTIQGEGYTSNTTLYYTIEALTGTIDGSDFTDGLTSGSFSYNSSTQTGTFTKIFSLDATSEASDTFVIKIRKDSVSGTVLYTSATYSILNASVIVAVSTNTHQEGASFQVDVFTTNVSTSTSPLYVKLTTNPNSLYATPPGSWPNGIDQNIALNFNGGTQGTTTFQSSVDSSVQTGTFYVIVYWSYNETILASSSAITFQDTTPYLDGNSVSFSPLGGVNEGQTLTATGTVYNLPYTFVSVYLKNFATVQNIGGVATNPVTVQTDGSGYFSAQFDILADNTTEGNETAYIQLQYNSSDITVIGNNQTTTINDTSTTPGGGGGGSSLASYSLLQPTAHEFTWSDASNYVIDARKGLSFTSDGSNYVSYNPYYTSISQWQTPSAPYGLSTSVYSWSSNTNTNTPFVYSDIPGDGRYRYEIAGGMGNAFYIYTFDSYSSNPNFNLNNYSYQGSSYLFDYYYYSSYYGLTFSIIEINNLRFSSDGFKINFNAFGYDFNSGIGASFNVTLSLYTAWRPDYGFSTQVATHSMIDPTAAYSNSMFSVLFISDTKFIVTDASANTIKQGVTSGTFNTSSPVTLSDSQPYSSNSNGYVNRLVNYETTSSGGRIYIQSDDQYTRYIRYYDGDDLLSAGGSAFLSSYTKLSTSQAPDDYWANNQGSTIVYNQNGSRYAMTNGSQSTTVYLYNTMSPWDFGSKSTSNYIDTLYVNYSIDSNWHWTSSREHFYYVSSQNGQVVHYTYGGSNSSLSSIWPYYQAGVTSNVISFYDNVTSQMKNGDIRKVAVTEDGSKVLFGVSFYDFNYGQMTYRIIVAALYNYFYPSNGYNIQTIYSPLDFGGTSSFGINISNFYLVNDSRIVIPWSGPNAGTWKMMLYTGQLGNPLTKLDEVNVSTTYTSPESILHYADTSPSAGRLYMSTFGPYGNIGYYNGNSLTAAAGGGGGSSLNLPVAGVGQFGPMGNSPYIWFNTTTDRDTFAAAVTSGSVSSFSVNLSGYGTYSYSGVNSSSIIMTGSGGPGPLSMAFYVQLSDIIMISPSIPSYTYLASAGTLTTAGGGGTFYKFYYDPGPGFVAVEFENQTARDSFVTAVAAANNSFTLNGSMYNDGDGEIRQFVNTSFSTSGSYGSSPVIYYAVFNGGTTTQIAPTSPNPAGSGTYTIP